MIGLNTDLKHKSSNTSTANLNCYHCGEPCPDDSIIIGEKVFCCRGCRLVYELLSEHDLCVYYDLAKTPGISPQEVSVETKFAYLDDPGIIRKIVDFDDGMTSRVTLKLPAMHCSSCIWLLENLYKANDGISSSQVNFPRKEVTILFNPRKTNLRTIIELLTSIGYEPEINLASIEQKVQKETTRSLYLKIGVAGFAFGNIMLLSLPEYLALQDSVPAEFSRFFGLLSFILAMPVLLFSSLDYFQSALNGLRQKSMNMDVPISLGILTLFLRSSYEILTATGVGFMDSFTGLVFLLLIGKLFQKKTYELLSFERDYRSYFPISVWRRTDAGEENVPIYTLKINDRILIRNQELIPADAVLLRGDGRIDYSFVTGEAQPLKKVSGDLIYAGGRQIGSTIELEIVKDVSQSYLTQLWNTDTFSRERQYDVAGLANRISKYFTITVLLAAILAAFYWLPEHAGLAINAFTAVLIVACPCALALSTPFTLGNVLRIFGRNGFYLRNANVIESMARISKIIFDKTGTLTRSEKSRLKFNAAPGERSRLSSHETSLIATLTSHSAHPMSRYISDHLGSDKRLEIMDFKERTGLGLSAVVDGVGVSIGSHEHINLEPGQTSDNSASRVFIRINGQYRGYFTIHTRYRNGLDHLIGQLQTRHKTALLTGDNEQDRKKLVTLFGRNHALYFRQSPYDKLNYIRAQRSAGEKVLMIGDGLNDAGALRESDIGISLSEDIHTFSPAADAILDVNSFTRLSDFLKFSRLSIKIIISSFIISFLYNLIGLAFAVQGTLSPLIAAILMPLSSISVVIFTTGTTSLIAWRMNMLDGTEKDRRR